MSKNEELRQLRSAALEKAKYDLEKIFREKFEKMFENALLQALKGQNDSE